jgi:hypothetical protein
MILRQAACKRLLLIGMVLGATAVHSFAEGTSQWSCAFGKGAWNPADWFFVSLRDMPGPATWIQKDACVENDGKTTSMLLKKKFSGDITMVSTMAFADRMAPTLMIATRLGDLKNGDKEYDEDLDITLWDEGINVWRHRTANGKSSFDKVAYCQFKVQKNTKYKLQVVKKGKSCRSPWRITCSAIWPIGFRRTSMWASWPAKE